MDGFITITGSNFTDDTSEFIEFERLIGLNDCDCEVPWTRFAAEVGEPDADPQNSGDCGNTDIVADDGGEGHAYYTIFDTDNDCSTEDDLYIAFRIRVADVVSGAFSFEVLVSNDGFLGNDDPDGIQCCNASANPGFEKEIQLATGGGTAGINVYDIDGFINGSNVTPDATYVLGDHANVAYACGTDADCPVGAEPVFYTFAFPLTELGFATCDNVLTDLSLAAVSSTSVNPVIAECNSVSDVGGVDDGADNSECVGGDCPAGCNADVCALANDLLCAAGEFIPPVPPLPVELVSFRADARSCNLVELIWKTETEVANKGFYIERSFDGKSFEKVGFVEAKGEGNDTQMHNYVFADEDVLNFQGLYFYRLRQIDIDGTSKRYGVVQLYLDCNKAEVARLYPQPSLDVLNYSLSSYYLGRDLKVKIYSSDGRQVYYNYMPVTTSLNNQLDLSDLDGGMYVIRFITSGITNQLKFIKA